MNKLNTNTASVSQSENRSSSALTQFSNKVKALFYHRLEPLAINTEGNDSIAWVYICMQKDKFDTLFLTHDQSE